MEERNAICKIGLGGWEHESLDDCFYPGRKGESLDKLRYYSNFFDTVEVRSTFWDDSLSAEDGRRWMAAVVDNNRFSFSLKLHSAFTHKREIKSDRARAVRSLLQELNRAERLCGLIAQFPYSFTNTSSNRYHLVKLSELFRGFTLFVELRHNSWDQPNLLSFLGENSLHPISADLPRMNRHMPFLTGTVGEQVYLRLHGRNDKGWLLNGMDTRYDYLYNGREINEISRRIAGLSKKCRSITVICNNTTHGKAVANAIQLASSVREGNSILAPQASISAFPFLQEVRSIVVAEHLLLPVQPYRQAS